LSRTAPTAANRGEAGQRKASAPISLSEIGNLYFWRETTKRNAQTQAAPKDKSEGSGIGTTSREEGVKRARGRIQGNLGEWRGDAVAAARTKLQSSSQRKTRPLRSDML